MNKTPILEKKVFSVFSEGTNQGNHAMVVSTSIPSQHFLEKKLVENLGGKVSVICYLQHTEKGEFNVRWENAVGHIRYCGHGALSVAAFLDKKGLLKNNSVIQFPAGRYWLRKEDALYWFSSKSDIQLDSSTYKFGSDVVNTEIVETASYLDDQGYLILRLSNDLDLSQIQPDLALLRSTTSRALIITSAQTRNPEFDYMLRYFAPQFGVPEDPATGSANEIAARFWHQRLGKQNMRCYQASAEGGVIHAQIKGVEIWIGGNVKPA